MDVVVEPSFLALGPFHMAVGINDRAWIYETREQGVYNIQLLKQTLKGILYVFSQAMFLRSPIWGMYRA